MIDSEGIKYLTASRLKALLDTIPGDTLVICNKVGNLLLLNEKQEYYGYIDFLFEGNVERPNEL